MLFYASLQKEIEESMAPSVSNKLVAPRWSGLRLDLRILESPGFGPFCYGKQEVGVGSSNGAFFCGWQLR